MATEVRSLSLRALLVIIAILLYSVAVQGKAVTIEFIYLAGNESTEQRWVAITSEFEKQNPDIKIKRHRVIGDYPTKLSLLIASGMFPDVVAIDMNDVGTFRDSGVFRDLSSLIEGERYSLKELNPVALALYQKGTSYWGIPFDVTPHCIYYNVDILEEAGLQPPEDLYKKNSWTWDVYRQYARKLTILKPGAPPSRHGGWVGLLRAWQWSNGGQEVDNPIEPTRPMFSEVESIEALTFIQELVLDGVMKYGGDIRQLTINGQVVMGSNWLSGIADVGRHIRVALVPFPKGPRPGGRYVTDIGVWGLCISAQSPNYQAAWRFMEFVTGVKGAELCAKYPGLVHPRRIPGIRLTWLEEVVTNASLIGDLVSLGKVRNVSRWRAEIERIWVEETRKLWNGSAPASTVAKILDDRISALLKGK